MSLAARTVRRHAMEMRDLANLALKDNQEPRDWSFFCAPILDRCCLLLRLAPVYGRSCERPSASGSADNVSCETEGRWRAAEDWGEVSGSGVRGVGGAFAGGLSEEGGAAACSSLFSSVHNDVKGGTHVQQVLHVQRERESAREVAGQKDRVGKDERAKKRWREEGRQRRRVSGGGVKGGRKRRRAPKGARENYA